jgi:hypothetical protein
MQYHHVDGGFARMEAERAFAKAARARSRAALLRRASLLRRCASCLRLAVLDEVTPPSAGRGVREISLDTIAGTLEPNRASQFDREFRPARSTRSRWIGIWLAEHRGTVLPPISVVRAGDGYMVRDGHHRVSVARARGAITIDAIIG